VNITGREMIDASGEAMYVGHNEIETGRKVNVTNRAPRDVSQRGMYVGRKVIETSRKVTGRGTIDANRKMIDASGEAISLSRKVMIAGHHPHRIRNKGKIVSGTNRGSFQ
jgi:hypothetical protein